MTKPLPARKSRPLKVAMRTENEFEWCAARLKALADPDRLRIVTCLFKGPMNVSELAGEMGEELVKISHHLGVLRHANVVETEKQGKFVVYRLHPEIAAAGQTTAETKTLDLGCCRLDLPKPGAGP
jgi:DNA-binding transcriptional ArsR family regulator